MTSERFIKDVLTKSGKRLIERQTQAISSSLQSQSGNLLSNRRMWVSGETLTLEHPDYERFLDMRKLAKKKHRRVKIHNRFVYGCYASIASWLMNGFESDVEETMDFSLNK